MQTTVVKYCDLSSIMLCMLQFTYSSTLSVARVGLKGMLLIRGVFILVKFVPVITLCLRKNAPSLKRYSSNYKDRFWWHLAKIFKML